MVDSPWTPERVERASRMWKEGNTYQDIIAVFDGLITVGSLKAKAASDRVRFPSKQHRKLAKIEVDLAPIAKLWAEGLSSSQIAAQTGLKAPFIRTLAQKNREMFPRRAGGGDTSQHKASRAAKTDPVLKAVVVQRMPVMPQGEYTGIQLDDYELARLPIAVTMADNNGCKYPLNEGGPFLFCGCDRYKTKPYCAYHVMKCRGVGTASERAAGKFDRKVA